MTPWVRGKSGRRINPLDVHPEDINLDDMAHGLACFNRFNGATPRPINVAHHSVWVSRLAEHFAPADRKTIAARQGLLHDGSEYILGDMTKWLKRTPELAAYREAERRAQRVIYSLYSCPLEDLPEVKQADDLMVRVEGEFAWGPNWSDVPGYGPVTAAERALVEEWWPTGWMESYELFLYRSKK